MAMPKLSDCDITEKISIALPASLLEWINQEAEKYGCTKAWVMRRILQSAKQQQNKNQGLSQETEAHHG